MYINSKEVRCLEGMCLNSRLTRNRSGLESRMHFLYEHHNQFRVKYDLLNPINHHELKIFLGEHFINFDTKNFDYFTDQKIHMCHNPYNQKSKIENKVIDKSTIHYKITNLNNLMDTVYPDLEKLMYIKEVLDFTWLINLWQDLAKQHNIDISKQLKPAVEIIENYQFNHKLLKKIKKDGFTLVDKMNNLFMRLDKFSQHHNLPFGEFFFEPDSLSFKSLDTPEFRTNIDLLENLIVETQNNIKYFENMVDIKSMTSHENMQNNSTVLINVLAEVFEILKDKLTINQSIAIDFLNNTENDEDRFNHFKNKIILLVDNVSLNNIHYKKVVIFKDETIAVLPAESNHYEIYIHLIHTKDLVKKSLMMYLKNELRKNPTISKLFTHAFEKNIEEFNNANEHTRYHLKQGLSFGKILSSIDTYFNHQNILKSEGFDFVKNIENEKSFEKLDDNMHKIIREHNIKKYADSIVSNKYKHLYNNESYKLFKELYDLKIERSILQDLLGKKLAAVKSKELFNENIKSLLNSFNDFDISTLKIKAKSSKATIIAESADKLILEIDSFEQSKLLGSPSWCISRNEGYFLDYIKNGGKQYFIYDFSQTSRSSKSIVGITLTKNFEMKTGHSKNDAVLRDKALVNYVITHVKKHYKVEEIVENAS